MNFSMVIELACVVAYITIIFGGRRVREMGWKMLAGLLSTVAASQLIAMALVVSLWTTEHHFQRGYRYMY